jgi:8-oxo-dGTP pyrophosphatase MutT (NUDIX family)
MISSIEIGSYNPSHPILSPDKKPLISSVGVFAVIGRDSNFYVAVCQGQNGWSIPAGRVEASDQDLLSAAIREFREETEGSLSEKEITHLGVVTRSDQSGMISRSLVFRAKVDLYHFGIDHSMNANRIIRIGGDKEVSFIMFRQIDEMLPAPVYRPEINLPVVKAFRQIKD